MKKLLVCVAGLPGVGKSKLMSNFDGVPVIDVDKFKNRCAKKQIDTPDMRWEYYKTALLEAFEAFDKGVSVVMVGEVFHLRKLRFLFENLCKKHQVNVLWCEVICSYKNVKKRLLLPTFKYEVYGIMYL
jgi:predicted kinase